MKKVISITMIAVMTLSGCIGINALLATTTASSKSSVPSGYTIIIDAGHGGIDVGANGVDGSNEKDINLAIALRLYDFMRICGIDCVMIRNGDYEIYGEGEGRVKSDLYNRMDMINSVTNPILISIHQNHYDDPAEWGSQVWYSANTDKSKSLAASIQSTIQRFIQPGNKRQNKESDDNYYLLYRAVAPSVMVECGFLSNPEENMHLQDDRYQKQMAYSIMMGTCKEI